MSRAKFATIYQGAWSSRVFNQVRDVGDRNTLLFAMWLTTNDLTNFLGLYTLDRKIARDQTLIDDEGLNASIRRLAELDYLTYDPVSEVVWIHSCARYQLGLLEHNSALKVTDLRVKGARRLVGECPSEPMRDLFIARYNDRLKLGYPADAVEKEIKVRKRHEARLIGPSLAMIQAMGVRL